MKRLRLLLPLLAGLLTMAGGARAQIAPVATLGGLGAQADQRIAVATAKTYGAKADVKTVTDAAITSGAATLTSATAAFTAADAGKTVSVLRAGASGAPLVTTISTVNSGTSVTLAASAGLTFLAPRTVSDAAITAAATTLTSATAAFTAADAGQQITISGAGASGATLAEVIVSVTNSTTAVVSVAASTTVSGATLSLPGATVVWGTDNTTAINAALTAQGNAGGGVVTAPAGAYLIAGNVTIPAGVWLTGTYQGAQTHNGYRDAGAYPTALGSGTALFIAGGAGSSSGTAAITVGTNAGLGGVTLYYPGQPQTVSPPVAFPFAIAMRGKNPSVVNVEMINPYQGIDINNTSNSLAGYTERPTVQNVTGQPLSVGIEIGNLGLGGIYDIPRLQNIHFNPTWSFAQATTDIPASVYNWQLANGTSFLVGDVDEVKFSECFTYGYRYGVHMTKPSRGSYGSWTGGGIDTCYYPIYSDGSQAFGWSFFGVGIAGSNQSNSVGVTLQTGTGDISFAACRFWQMSNNGFVFQTASTGTMGTTSFTGCLFKDWSTGFPALSISLGNLLVTGCDFQTSPGASGHIACNTGAKLIATGNMMKGTVTLTGAGTITNTGNLGY